MAYQKILVPLDGSLLAEEALKQAVQVAAPGATIHLLSVMSIDHVTEVAVFASAAGQPFQPVDPSFPSHMQDVDSDEIKARQSYLNKIGQRLTDQGYQVKVEVKTLEIVPDVISNLTRSGGYDVVVMATHGRTGLSKLMLGSVTQAVLASAMCPVLVVPPIHTDRHAHRSAN